MAEQFVGTLSEFKDGDRRIVLLNNLEIGVFRQDGRFYAYSNTCLHSGGPACEGLLINQVVDIIAPDRTYQGQTFGDDLHFVCPWHGYEYDIRTGEHPADPRARLRPIDVEEREGEILVRL